MCTFLLQNGALWDIGLVHCGIYETSLFVWHNFRFTRPWWLILSFSCSLLRHCHLPRPAYVTEQHHEWQSDIWYISLNVSAMLTCCVLPLFLLWIPCGFMISIHIPNGWSDGTRATILSMKWSWSILLKPNGTKTQQYKPYDPVKWVFCA